MATLNQLKKELRSISLPEKAKQLARFFKTGKGEYGEGDIFIGVTVPNQREVAKKYCDLSLSELICLLHSKEHEFRLIALFILVHQFKRGTPAVKEKIFKIYTTNIKWINNWDLVDSSAPHIVGKYLLDKDTSILFKLARSPLLWDRRVAMLATFSFIREGKPEIAIKIAEILVDDKHDLIQKAVGWMLREIGKEYGIKKEAEFLDKHYRKMPRTMLRYAIEKFPEKLRRYYLA
jgi:3-methyladenine DNA glycosylase AlkD